jgi:hypothetical protein
MTLHLSLNATVLELSLSRVKFGKPAKRMLRITDDTMKVALVNYYNRHHPQVTLSAREVTPNTTPLLLHADVYNYALLDGRRITSTSRSMRNNASSSLIQARFGTETCTGEVRAILSHRQPGVPSSEHKLLVMVAWMKESGFSPLNGGDDGFMWRKL